MRRRGWMGGALLTVALRALLAAAGAGARPLLAVTITNAPPGPTTSTDATFAFSADLRDATAGSVLQVADCSHDAPVDERLKEEQ